ncbi:unnamed protein product [Adineta ricciae]|uniref:Uncharacterized protein n=1 Tax=Adineta ricciae TaxID=249248 RepID=A0A813WL97_ADIRI|nr:unnamed protein product [Adineta ricciae]
MAANTLLVISALLFVCITTHVQSIPIEKAKETIPVPSIDQKQELQKSVDSVGSSSDSTTSTTTISSQTSSTESTLKQDKNEHKSKRNILDNDQFDDISVNEDSEEGSEQPLEIKSNSRNNPNGHVLHTNVAETLAQIHDNAYKPVDIDDSNVFSDIKMTPNELTDIVRRRRDVKLNMEPNRRRKRALSAFDLYDTDPLYHPYDDLLEARQYLRSARSFAPLYWYPNVYERNVRSAFIPSLYETPEWARLSSANIIDDDDDDNLVSLYGENNDDVDDNDDDDGEMIDYELNRYPILSDSVNNPFDNLQLQQRYNTDDLPLDDDSEESSNDDGDSDEAQYRSFYENQYPYYTRFGSLDTYFE